MSLPKLTNTEKRVLLKLMDGWRKDSNVYTFKGLARELNTTRSAVKRACRSLVRKGLTEHSPFWDEYDGNLGGSGYTLSVHGMMGVRFHEEDLKDQVEKYVPRRAVQKLQDAVPTGGTDSPGIVSTVMRYLRNLPSIRLNRKSHPC